jgi:hypothetical protein
MWPVGAGTTKNEAELAIDRRPEARSVEESSTAMADFITGLRRACSLARAAELHINQPAINKRKRAAIQHLRALL